LAFVSLVAFWFTSLLFVITPGADWAYAISAGLRGRTFPAVAGLITGHLIATAIVAAGVGTALAQLPLGLTLLTIAGAAYLVWLGISTLLNPPSPTESDVSDTTPPWRWYGKGVGVSGLNPKVFLLFLALLPQFTSPDAVWPLPLQIAVLGLLHTLSCTIVYLAVGFGARSILGARPEAARLVSRVSGAAMIVIAIVLIVEQIAPIAGQLG
jgi:threonine/homoserine/homoserine lactone efflux protein